MENRTVEFFECSCRCDEHTLKFEYDVEDKQMYATMFLCEYLPFWKRIGLAVKYIFGFKSKYGHFDSWILNSKDAERLQEFTSRIIQDSLESKEALIQTDSE